MSETAVQTYKIVAIAIPCVLIVIVYVVTHIISLKKHIQWQRKIIIDLLESIKRFHDDVNLEFHKRQFEDTKQIVTATFIQGATDA